MKLTLNITYAITLSVLRFACSVQGYAGRGQVSTKGPDEVFPTTILASRSVIVGVDEHLTATRGSACNTPGEDFSYCTLKNNYQK